MYVYVDIMFMKRERERERLVMCLIISMVHCIIIPHYAIIRHHTI